MKSIKIALGISVLALAVCLVTLPASAAGKSAPKTTGSVGYTAYGLQRYAQFDAQQTDSCTSSVSMTGSYVFTLSYGGGNYPHDINLIQSGTNLTGTGGYPAGDPNAYSIHETITGTVTGNTFTFTSTYTETGYSFTVNGTINTNGTLTVTDWSSNAGQSGTNDWAVSGKTHTVTTCSAKGTFTYSDVNGSTYTVKVMYINVSGNTAWFAGPVVSGNVGAGNWLITKVVDNGEPGINQDQIWGSFTTQSAAITGVANMVDPVDGPFTITSGNIQVH